MPISPRRFFTASGSGWKTTPDDTKKSIIEKLVIRAKAIGRMHLVAANPEWAVKPSS